MFLLMARYRRSPVSSFVLGTTDEDGAVIRRFPLYSIENTNPSY